MFGLPVIPAEIEDFESLIVIVCELRQFYWYELGEIFTMRKMKRDIIGLYKEYKSLRCTREEINRINKDECPNELLPDEYVNLFYYVKIYLREDPEAKNLKNLVERRLNSETNRVKLKELGAMKAMYGVLKRGRGVEQLKSIDLLFFP